MGKSQPCTIPKEGMNKYFYTNSKTVPKHTLSLLGISYTLYSSLQILFNDKLKCAINEVMKIITFKKRLNLKAPCEIIGGWQFGDIWEIDCKEGMVRILRVKPLRRVVVEFFWFFGKKKNTPKKIRLWYYVEVERGLLRNNDLTFSLINNEYIYANLKHKNRKQSTQNTKIGNNPRISPKHKNRKLQLIKRI